MYMDKIAVFHKTHNEFDPWRNTDLKVSGVKSTYFVFSGETKNERESGEW